MISSDTTDKLFTALHDARQEFPEIDRNAKAHYGKFADLNHIREQVDPVLEKHGLFIVQIPDTGEAGEPALTTILRHSSGQWIMAIAALALSKKDPQAQGSAITYMKRYAYTTVLGLKIDDDDDGDSASLPDSQVSVKRQGQEVSKEVADAVKELYQAAKQEAGKTKAQTDLWFKRQYNVLPLAAPVEKIREGIVKVALT